MYNIISIKTITTCTLSTIIILWIRLFSFHAACVTILPNDDPYGVFRFDDRSISTTISEPQGATSTGNGKFFVLIIILCNAISEISYNAVAQLTVVRDRGLFEQVTVPFEIRQLGSQQGKKLYRLFY